MPTPPAQEPRPGFEIRAALRRIPGAVGLVRGARNLEHRLALRFARRRNYTYTSFCRLPTQLDVLATEVVDFVHGDGSDEIRIIVFGCSIGAEPYSMASALHTRRPELRFRLECFDLEPSTVSRAQGGTYTTAELTAAPPLTQSFITSTFDVADASAVVKPALRAMTRFAQGNVLDPALIKSLGQADIVVAQNFLYHLARPDATRAFAHLFSLMKPRAALLVDGADIDMRTRLTAEAGLRPCATDLRKIHDESRVLRGYAWPRIYWGLEPFDASRSDAERRFATIFFADGHLER